MEKINNTIKIKLIFILFLSNITVYLMASPEIEEAELTNSSSPYERKGYTEFKVQAKLFTSFQQNKPISIISDDKKLLIPFALLLEEVNLNEPGSLIQERMNKEYIIYIPEFFIAKLLNKKGINLIPYGKDIKLRKIKKVRRYEISI